MRTLVAAVGVATALTAAAPAGAATRYVPVANARCGSTVLPATPHLRLTLGPLRFSGWDGYANWANMEGLRSAEGTYYAKSAMYARHGAASTVSIASAYRASADLIYGQGANGSHVLSDTVRVHPCKRGTTFFSGGLIVRGPTCVEIRVRRRGSPRVHRKMISIDRGSDCPTLAPL